MKKRIFVVEDNASVRKGVVESINRETDLAVCGQAEDAPAALDIVAAGDVDLVLTDIRLRSSDGIELIRELRRLYPSLPIVAMTMFDPVQYERLALPAGANVLVAKQGGVQKIITTIRAALECQPLNSGELNESRESK